MGEIAKWGSATLREQEGYPPLLCALRNRGVGYDRVGEFGPTPGPIPSPAFGTSWDTCADVLFRSLGCHRSPRCKPRRRCCPGLPGLIRGAASTAPCGTIVGRQRPALNTLAGTRACPTLSVPGPGWPAHRSRMACACPFFTSVRESIIITSEIQVSGPRSVIGSFGQIRVGSGSEQQSVWAWLLWFKHGEGQQCRAGDTASP